MKPPWRAWTCDFAQDDERRLRAAAPACAIAV